MGGTGGRPRSDLSFRCQHAEPRRDRACPGARSRGARGRRHRAHRGRAARDRGGGLRPLRARADRARGRRLREHRTRLREGARHVPGADVPRAPASAVRGDARQGGDLPLPPGPRLPLHRGRAGGGTGLPSAARRTRRLHRLARDRPRPGRPAHDPARHAALVPGRARRRDRLRVLDREPRRARHLHRP